MSLRWGQQSMMSKARPHARMNHITNWNKQIVLTLALPHVQLRTSPNWARHVIIGQLHQCVQVLQSKHEFEYGQKYTADACPSGYQKLLLLLMSWTHRNRRYWVHLVSQRRERHGVYGLLANEIHAHNSYHCRYVSTNDDEKFDQILA